MIQRVLSRFFPKGVLLLTLIMLAPLLAACEDAELEAWVDLGLEWADANGFLNEEGLDILGISAEVANETVSDWLGGDEEDAGTDAWQVVDDINAADKLAEEARETGDVSKLDEAIALRPDDWRYQDQKGAILLAQNNEDGNGFGIQSGLIINEQVKAGGNCVDLILNRAIQREQMFADLVAENPDNQNLSAAYNKAQDEVNTFSLNKAEGTTPVRCSGSDTFGSDDLLYDPGD